MNNTWTKIIIFGLILMLVLAPFAGLAPLLLLLLVAAVASAFWSVLQILVSGKAKNSNS